MEATYEQQLERLAEFVQSRHPVGKVKHIGICEATQAAIEIIERLEFESHLEFASRAVAAMPAWKQSALGAAAARDRPKLSLVEWLGSSAIKDVRIVRQNGRYAPATRLDWPLLRIVAKQPVWQDFGKTCVFLNTYDPPRGVHGNAKPSEAWQMVIATARRPRAKRKSH